MSVSKKVGLIADKMLNITEKAAKKLEIYAAKSAEENDNENARKLSHAMEKLQQKISDERENYISNVEQNAEDLIKQGKLTLNKIKKTLDEMKTRAETAKQKAEDDAAGQDSDNNGTPNP